MNFSEIVVTGLEKKDSLDLVNNLKLYTWLAIELNFG